MSAGLFTYVLRWDTGFAPNPHFGICTLATCKPGIRKSAEPGDWVAGIGSTQNQLEGRLVNAMGVEEKLSFDEYWTDPRFAEKKPNLKGSREQCCGDNIYHQTPDGEWVQEKSLHRCSDCNPNHYHLNRDTSVPSVLASKSFAYYGTDAIKVRDEFRDWEGQDYFSSVRGYRRHFPDDLRIAFTSWLDSMANVGKTGEPSHRPPTHTQQGTLKGSVLLTQARASSPSRVPDPQVAPSPRRHHRRLDPQTQTATHH